MHSSRIAPKLNAISKLSDPKMSKKKAPHAYQPLGNHAKQVNVDRNCSSISWFVILTCSVLGLFLIFLNSSTFPSDVTATVYIERSINPSAKVVVAESSVEKSVEILDHYPADEESDADSSADQSDNPSAKIFETESSAEESAEKSDNSIDKNPSAKTSNAESSAKKSAEKSDNSSDTNPSIKASDAESSVEKSAEKSDNPSDKKPDNATTISANQSAAQQYDCTGKYIHILDIPSEFNTDLLKNCSTLSPWTTLYCDLIKNTGFGPRLDLSDQSVFSDSGWYSTDQFTLEIIFHNRMKHYRCLTNDSSKASAIFVPYYAGMDVARYLWNPNVTLRDAVSVDFAEYVQQTPEWKKMGGRDHFLVLGRLASDFGRLPEISSESGGWGNYLSHIPGIRNMTNLLLEASLSSKAEVAIPYPTYFHPSSPNEVHSWQETMREKSRPYLFSFAGGPRPNMKGSIRNELIRQCLAAQGNNCKFINCSSEAVDCRMAETVMRLFQSSDFCLQPPGDTFTRKSFFDTILSGCIPIIFHPASAYVQYLWHLPKNYSSYSVFMPIDEVKNGSLSIEKRLLEIPKEKVKAMREEVIKLIPRIIYANPNKNLHGLEDAFEVTVKGVLDRVAVFKKEMNGPKNPISESVPDHSSWKYNFFGDLEHNDWDKYFDGSISIY